MKTLKSTVTLVLAVCCLGLQTAAADSLDAAFLKPPPEARPWVYWMFMDGNMTREGITADLEAMAKAGIGGAIFMEVDVGIPRGPVEFMGPQWQVLLHHAIHEAQRLGLDLALNAGPGWTGSGGPWIRPEQSMQHLVASETNLTGPVHFQGPLAKPAPRSPFFGEATLTPELKKARDNFYQDVVVLAFPTPAAQARIVDIDEKALYYRAPFSSQPAVKPFLPATAEHAALPAGQCIPAAAILDLTSKLSAEGRLDWDVPAGNWTVLRLGRRSTGQTTRPAPLPGLGFECDKFDPAALDAQYAAFIRTLLAGLGPRTAAHGWTMLHIDSWEMSSQNWTARFREEFQRRRGYDLLDYLPVMTGRVVGSLELSERFLWDLRRTAQELVVQNHALHLRDLGHRDRFGLSIEPYDLNPAGDLSLGSAADVPMCEFWAKGHGFDTEFSTFESVSIGHTLGRRILASESFTSGDSERWQLYPGALKGQGDWALCAGVNRLVFHRYQHQPWLDRFPGMTMGPYGVHWERTETWWDMAAGYHQYLARCQCLLRRGSPVADICYLAPEGAPHVFRPPKSATRGDPPDRLGYNFDGCAPEVLIHDASVQAGRLLFRSGMTYRVLVLPRFDTMTPALLGKINDLVQAGLTIVGTPPRKSPSLSNYPQCDADLQGLAAALWGAQPVPDRHVGKGRVIWDTDASQGGTAARVAPPPLANARWIWHAADGNAAVAAPIGTRYFRRVLTLPAGRDVLSARCSMSADNSFKLWVNGQAAGQGDNYHRLAAMDVAALLRPGTNVLAVAAENGGDQPNPAGLIGALTIRFDGGDTLAVQTDTGWASATTAGGDWLRDATAPGSWVAARDLGPYGMGPWNQVQENDGFPDIYPDYSTTARLLAAMDLPPDFQSQPFLRYTHRRDGAVDIYFVANPEARPVQAQATFRVTGRRPELWDPVTGEQRALPGFAQQAGGTSLALRFEPHQSFFIVFRKRAGHGPAVGPNFAEARPVQDVTGPWEVAFQPHRGAPERVTFDALTDWSRDSIAGVRNFSGIATYRAQFDWKPRDGRIFLDLGRVEVMAAVRLNGHDLGPVWTAPLRVEVTGALKPGSNLLEIRVANLWLNRLIGDAALPQDQRVAWTTWNPFKSDTPLRPSGLLGPVRLAAE